MKIKGAIFDVDGTLLDSMAMWFTFGERYLKNNGKDIIEGHRDQMISMGIRQSSAFLIENYGLKKTVAQVGVEIDEMVEGFFFKEAILKKGVVELLERMKSKGIKMILATATNTYLIKACFERLGLLHYFEDVLTCPDLETTKDVPLIFEKALEVLGLDKRDAVVFEDSPIASVTALKAGFRVAFLQDDAWGITHEEAPKGMEIYLDNINDLVID